MPRSLLFLLSFVLYAISGLSQTNYGADQISTEMKTRASAVLREMETKIEMKAADNMVMSVKKVVTVLHKNGDYYGGLALWYNKNTSIKNIRGLLLDANGNITGKFNQSNFSDESAVSSFSLFEDDRIKRYFPSSISYPYTVIYEYEIKFKQNLIIPDWYANPYPDLSIEKNSYSFSCPADSKVRIKAVNYPGTAAESVVDNFLTRTWKVEHMSAIKPEPFAPDPDRYRIHIKIAAEDFVYFGHKGHYQNWKELGLWVYKELLETQQALSPALTAQVKNLVNGISSEEEKVKKIYTYVQQKTRYISVQIGIGGFQPFPAMDVDRLSYGDCKALVNYTQSLLTAVGIKSEYCVVQSGQFRKDIDPEFASMDQGDHVILSVPLANDTIWLECTSQHAPFGYLGSFTDGRTVLACTENGGKIYRTPALSAAENTLKRYGQLTLDKEGNIEGNLRTELRGSLYEKDEEVAEKTASEQLKWLKEEYDINNIDFSHFKIEQLKDKSPVATESFKLTVQRYAAKANGKLYLIPNLFNRSTGAPEIKDRKLPVYVNRGYEEEDRIEFELPENFMIDGKPEDWTVNTKYGSYSALVEKKGNVIIYERKLKLHEGSFPPEEYNAFSAFLNEAKNADYLKIILQAK